mmetsp:Transcript_1143/g.2522  ORF Transcript_1143/g.2522 Transcript_1143/m.2522 type:complete len:571 (+) Transcript_1143:294-2006(+)
MLSLLSRQAKGCLSQAERLLAGRATAVPDGLQLSRRSAPLRWHSSSSSSAGSERSRLTLGEGLAAALASAAAVAVAGGSVLLAKEDNRKTTWQVYVWGRSEAIPGGSERDILIPKRMEWFDKHEAGWSKIAFGPNFGVALDRRGQLFIWGEIGYGDEDIVGPVAIELTGEAKGRSFIDVQCASDKFFATTSKGHALIFQDILDVMSQNKGATTLKLEGKLVPGIPQPGIMSPVIGGGGIKTMGIGMEHGCFVTFSGDVYCVGGNEWGQCGKQPPKQKGIMGALEERARFQVETPHKVQMPPEAGRIVEVAVGGRHTVVRDVDGNAWSFGDDRRIQLGLGDTRSKGHDERNSYGVITQENLGGKQTQHKRTKGATYKYYDPHMQHSPTKLIEPEAYNRPPYPPPSFFACGEDFTIACHRDSPDWYSEEQTTNILMCCGENAEGQCGRNLQEQQQPWNQVRLPKRSRTASVSCGQQHCLALLTNGELYSWGASLQGQLGSGKRATRHRPMRVGLEPIQDVSQLEPVNISPKGQPPEWRYPKAEHKPFPGKIVSISAGFRNSAVICEVPPDAQ